MKKQVKEKESHTGESEPPAEEPVVNSLQGRGSSSGEYVPRNDEGDPNPQGRTPSDKVPLKSRKRSLTIATWNVRTLLQLGKLDNLCKEADDLKTDIIGVAETRWTDEGCIKKDNYTFIHSGGAESKHGVGFLISNAILKHVKGYLPVNERCILLKIKARPFDISLLQVYAPTSDYTDEEVELFYETVDNTIKEVKSSEVLVVMGDFNAKIGVEKHQAIAGGHGLGVRNDRGTRLVHFCEEHKLAIMNTYFQIPKRQLYTWKSPGDIIRNQIDYILISQRFRHSIKRCRTYPGADIGSDHNPVVARMKVKLKCTNTKAACRQQFDIDGLKIETIRQQYNITVQNKYQALINESSEQHEPSNVAESIDRKWKALKDSMTHGLTILPKKKKKKNKIWMTDEILNIMQERKVAKIESDTTKYKKLNKLIKKECIEAREKWLSEKCKELEEMHRNKSNKIYEGIRELSNPKTKTPISGCITSKQGKILFETEEIKKRWSEYTAELFEDDRPTKPEPPNLDGPRILESEVAKAIRISKNGKAPGPDGLTSEMIKALDRFSIEKLTVLYNEIYECGHLPNDFLDSVFITLPKKPKAKECSDFRTISLMSHHLKIFLTIILGRMKNKLNQENGKEQFGFQANKGTRDAIFCFNILTQKQMEVQKDLYACFIDYAKAFDRVKHSEMVETLARTGIDGKDIRIITELYWNQKAAIRVDQELSEPASIQRGVRQGCVLSPYLFNIYTEYIFRESNDMYGLNINGININNIRYVDDTTLLASNNEDLQKIFDVVKSTSVQKGLDMNVKKTKTMVISKKEGIQATIQVDGKQLEQVQQFKYLGQTITNEGKSNKEIQIRIAQAKSMFMKLNDIFMSRDISLDLRLRAINLYVFSILLYGDETWTLNGESTKKLEALEMWIFRRLARVSYRDRVSNEEVMRRLGIERGLLSQIKTHKLSYFGHVARHDSLQKTVLTGRMEGRRGRGRPRRQWYDDIKDWTGNHLYTNIKLAQFRVTWRSVASRPQNGPQQPG